MRFVAILAASSLLFACASMPQRIDSDGAVSAARNLIRASKTWAEQATYTPQHKQGDWLVVVSCNKCTNTDGSAIAAEYIVRVDAYGKASILVGLND
ncbi:MAG TPA: hypothetical protein VGH80_04215 [Xanthomonadaceae bacterium]